jgi:hypothetical protein
MSTPELPSPTLVTRETVEWVEGDGPDVAYFTADQMREMYRAGRLAGLEEAAKECEAQFEPHNDNYHDHAVQQCVSAIRSLKEKQG